MHKNDLLKARVQVLNAFMTAKAPFSLLIRKEWEKRGYVQVPATRA